MGGGSDSAMGGLVSSSGGAEVERDMAEVLERRILVWRAARKAAGGKEYEMGDFCFGRE